MWEWANNSGRSNCQEYKGSEGPERKKGSDFSTLECRMEAFDAIGMPSFQFRVIKIPSVPLSLGVPISSKSIKMSQYTRFGCTPCHFFPFESV